MAMERLSMQKIREILRAKWALGRSHREVRDLLGVSLGAITATLRRAAAAGLDWAQVQALSEDELDRRLHGGLPQLGIERPMPDCAWIHTERRRPGVTLELLHIEYLQQQPDGYRYSAFCEHYQRWLKKRKRSMRQVHRAGEKTFVDFSGKKPHLIDPRDGRHIDVELFVAVLGASNYTYAEATRTQRSADWIGAHIGAFEYFGGVSAVVVPDQLKSGVRSPCRYEPLVQRTYREMAEHYGTVVVPARPGKPKDKAKVEVGVQVVQRWVLARLRKQRFFSLEDLNERIGELLEDLNQRPMRDYGASRRELFERLDAPALRPLPEQRFVYAEWKTARVNIDYHVELDRHYYSVPHALVRELVELRYTAATVEVYCRGQRVAAHPRSHRRGMHTTTPEHMPKAHREHLAWTPSRLIHWAHGVGPKTRELVAHILVSRPHPEQGYRTCLGILRLEKKYGRARLEAASQRALHLRARSYRHVAAILDRGLDRLPLPTRQAVPTPVAHENVRGGDYYR